MITALEQSTGKCSRLIRYLVCADCRIIGCLLNIALNCIGRCFGSRRCCIACSGFGSRFRCAACCTVKDLFNACAELYIAIITARVQADKSDLHALWRLVCVTTTAVMGDAPLTVAKAEKKELAVRMEGEEEDSAVIETRSAPEKEQEWTWQVEFGRVCQK